MMFGQLSNRESLRDLIVAFEAKTTLASANQNRDCRIFEDFAFYMMKEACEKRTTNILNIPGKKYAFDSTTIPLCLSTFPWAYDSFKELYRIHLMSSYYVVRAKTNIKYKVVKWKRRMQILSISLTDKTLLTQKKL